MYPSGLNKSASDEEINISFRPSPNYAALAEAAAGSEVGWDSADRSDEGWMRGVRVKTVTELRDALRDATLRVGKQKKGMLIEVLM